MPESKPGVRGWWAERHLNLARLHPRARRTARVGLVLAGAAALAIIMPTWPGVALGRSTCTAPAAQQLAAFAGAAASLAALAYGLSLVAAAATAPGAATWRLPRTRYVLTLLLPVVLLLTVMVQLSAAEPSLPSLLLNHVRGVWLFVALLLILTVAVATRLRGPREPWGTGLVIAVGLAAIAAFVLFTGALAGLCSAVLTVAGMLTVLGFFGLLAVPVLLVWLAAEGLRLSGSLATWAMDRRPEGTLLAVLLTVKVAAIVAALVLVVVGAAPPWLAGFRPALTTWLFAAVLVGLVCLLLSAEERLVGSGPDEYALVTRWFALLVTSALAFLPVTGIQAALDPAAGRPVLVAALAGVAVVAVLVGRRLHRRGPGTIALVGGGVVLAYALLTLAWLGPRTRVVVDGSGASVLGTLLAVGLPVLAAVVATIVALVLRPDWRRHLVFGIGLLVWVALTIGLPLATGGRLGSDPVVFDLLLTVVIAGLAVAGRAGWQRALSNDELVLLLVTTTVIIELPLLLGALPDALDTPLLVFAFLSPGLAAVAYEAGPLNDDPVDAPYRVHTTVGLIGVGYGVVSAMALSVRDPLPLMQDLAGVFNGVAAVPFAVVLVAVLSADRQRARYPPPAEPVSAGLAWPPPG